MIYITKRFHFSSSHRMYNPSLGEDENRRIYGKCSNPNGHGHNYILEVTVAGDPDTGTGYVMDLTDLKNLVESELIDKVDHKNLNLDVPFLKGVIPSTENIVKSFWDRISGKLNSGTRRLHSLKLYETENNIVEYRGPNE